MNRSLSTDQDKNKPVKMDVKMIFACNLNRIFTYKKAHLVVVNLDFWCFYERVNMPL